MPAARRAWVEAALASGGEVSAAAAAAWLAGDTPEAVRLHRAGGCEELAALGARPATLDAARLRLQVLAPAAALCTPEELAAPPWFREQCTAVRTCWGAVPCVLLLR
jgi:hypothetical protein